MSASVGMRDAPPDGYGCGFPTRHIVIRLAKKHTSDSGDLRVVARDDGLPNLQKYLADNRHLRAARVIRHTSAANLRERELIASRGAFTPTQTLTAYWRIDARADDPESVLRALRGMPEVSIAYHEAEVRNASLAVASSRNNPRLPKQGYLEREPKGIGALEVSSIDGCDGRGVKVIDLESDWILDHEDLPKPQLLYGDRNSANARARNHGAAALGIVGAKSNSLGIIGVAPKLASLNVVSHFDAATGTRFHVADAIDAATKHLGLGDILLLEVQRDAYPTETDSADWHAIRLAVAQGIVVVEAAGNGWRNLDDWSDPSREHTLNVGADKYVDSGAIMVGSAFDTVLMDGGVSGHRRYYTSNFGSRVNVYAWGEHIHTAGFGDAAGTPGASDSYTSAFGETSGAAAIIAGAAAVVQSWLKAATADTLSSVKMREVLSNASTSTPQALLKKDPIGVMPDLERIVSGGLPLISRIRGLLRGLGLIPRKPRDAFERFRSGTCGSPRVNDNY
jgi:serine protease